MIEIFPYNLNKENKSKYRFLDLGNGKIAINFSARVNQYNRHPWVEFSKNELWDICRKLNDGKELSEVIKWMSPK